MGRLPATSTSTTLSSPWGESPSSSPSSASVGRRRRVIALSLYSICVFIILLLQIAAIVFINVDDANISFIKEKISNEAAKIDIEDPEKLTPGRSLCRTCSSGSPPASPPSSSSSQSLYAVERGGRRECKDMLRLYRLN